MHADDFRAAVAAAHPGEELETLETHISWVFLAGDKAYKFKKPVNLGFADFSTLERRQHFCQEELRLNRRLVPQLYLDVLPVIQTSAGPRLGGEGLAEEFCVRMARFPQSALLAQALDDGSVTPQSIDRLAADIADFHDTCAVARPEDAFGEPAGIASRVQSVFAQAAAIAPQIDRQAAMQALGAWLAAQFDALPQTFADRKKMGYIRECHGDLHAGNMVLLAGRIVPFDCIDFNPDLAYIDVLSDVAFAVMDFEHRGRRDLANRFLNGYMERSGDYPGLPVLSYYLAYRALVRAAVAGIRLAQEETASSRDQAATEDIARQRRQVREYIDLAAEITRRSAALLAITHGPSGSGKSTFARRLAQEIPAIVLRSDVERRRQFLDPHARYSAAATQWTYRRLFELANTALLSGFSVVLDATFLSYGPRQEAARLAKQHGMTFVILDLQTPRATLHARVAHRRDQGHDASEATAEVLRRQLAARESLRADELPHAITIDTTSADAAEQMTSDLRQRLREQRSQSRQ